MNQGVLFVKVIAHGKQVVVQVHPNEPLMLLIDRAMTLAGHHVMEAPFELTDKTGRVISTGLWIRQLDEQHFEQPFHLNWRAGVTA